MFEKEIGKIDFVQENESKSVFGSLRGLHYQLPPFAQSKLVRVISGRVLDIAVDVRESSSTFGKHVAVELSDENKKQLFIPRGFAPEYCEGMWRMLQLDKADDFVLSTGETNTVREFTEIAFNELGIELEWVGENENEKGIVKSIKNEKLQILKETCHSELVSESKAFNQSFVNLEF